MQIRKTQLTDIPALLKIFDNARLFMAQNGNPNQWPSNYPNEQGLLLDIQKDQSYVCIEKNEIKNEVKEEIVGTFVLMFTEEPTYASIDGAWLNNLPYGTLHRIASSGKVKKLSDIIFTWASKQIPELRCDTHADNIFMQNAFLRNGFVYCGIITLANGDLRNAYQRIAQ